MSHYNLLVVGENVDAALAPFNTDHRQVPASQWVFRDAVAEHEGHYQTGTCAVARGPDGQIEMPLRERYATIEDYLREVEGSEIDPILGRYGSWWNPQGKWDWFVLGGRWNGQLILTPGATSGRLGKAARCHPSGALGAAPLAIKPGCVDSALKRDVDWAAMQARSVTRLSTDYQDWQAATPEQRGRWAGAKDYPPRAGESLSDYLARQHKPWHCYAFLSRDGVWHERATWQGGTLSESGSWVTTPDWEVRFRALLAAVADTDRISVVDYHN